MIPRPPAIAPVAPAQPDLFDPKRVATVAGAEVSWLERLLTESRCWMSAADIRETTNGRVTDRDVRETASGCPRIISGQKGYKHIAYATAEEINHAANWLESQAKKMSDRACAIRRHAHRILG